MFIQPQKTLGSVDISSEPNERADKTKETQVVLCQLIKAREDSSIVLDFIDEAFNQVPLTIQVFVILTLVFAILARRNHGLRPGFRD